MKHKLYRHGFTIVELAVVISVIGILATIVTVQYSSVKRDARDHLTREAAAQFEEAIEAWAARHNGVIPNGGYNMAAGTPDGTDGCTNAGRTGWQNANYSGSGYTCTLGDVMIYSNYLPSDFFTKLPVTKKYDNNQTNFMTELCTNNSKQTLLLYSLESPTKAEAQNYSSVLAKCGQTNLHTSEGMNAVILLEASQ